VNLITILRKVAILTSKNITGTIIQWSTFNVDIP